MSANASASKNLPDCAGLENIEKFEVCQCYKLAVLPDWVGTVGAKVEKLSLRRSAFATLPPLFGSTWSCLSELSFLDCSHLTTLPETMVGLVGLKMLDLSDSSLVEVPAWISKLSGLEVLALRRCVMFTGFPETIGDMLLLKSLEVRNCPKMTAMTESVGSAPALETFVLMNCGAEAGVPFPKSLAQSKTLARISFNHYESGDRRILPAEFADLATLTHLELHWDDNAELLAKVPERGVKTGSFARLPRACYG